MEHFTFEDLLKEAQALPLIPLSGSLAYQKNSSQLKQYVDEQLTAVSKINELVGHNPLQVMYENHKNHVAFMGTVFSIGHYELLARTIPWVYRAYHGHHFSYDYFPKALQEWQNAVRHFLPQENQTEILAVYQWMRDRHEQMIVISQEEKELPLPVEERWLEEKNAFRIAVLEGNHQRCLELAQASIKVAKDVESFYLQVVQPVMYEVGILWERGDISVAEEHLASAIVGRVMATVNMLDLPVRQQKRKAVISAAPNEFHEIGAWMVADILEQEGWQVHYLGANTPLFAILEQLHSFQPDILALSVTMSFNLLEVKKIIQAIRENEQLSKIKIIVGGRAFSKTPDLWKTIGADVFAENIDHLKKIVSKRSI